VLVVNNMPLIVICGRPCTGKTTRALEIKAYIEANVKDMDVVIINEESLGLCRAQAYADSIKEKEMRALLRSTVEKNLTNKNVVILDSVNFIKGVRYELYCLARTAKSTNCVVRVYQQVYCETPVEVAREWNAKREGDSYPPEVFEDLSKRMEEPNSRSMPGTNKTGGMLHYS
jgi:protein KTI12